MSGLKRLQVLVVDDNRHMRAITSEILASAGFGLTHQAESGPEGLRRLAETPMDLVIVDYKMAPMDGIAFVRQLRARPSSRFVPVIMLTGHANWRRVREARDAGVTEFMVKPIAPRLLLERIESLIERPRPFVVAEAYTGPCRRRRADAAYAGERRRAADQPVEIDA